MLSFQIEIYIPFGITICCILKIEYHKIFFHVFLIQTNLLSTGTVVLTSAIGSIKKKVQQPKSHIPQQSSETQKETSRRRSYRDTTKISERRCFVCNDQSQKDIFSYNKVGLGRCQQHLSKEKLVKAIKTNLEDETNKFHKVVWGLNAMIKGNFYVLQLMFATIRDAILRSRIHINQK